MSYLSLNENQIQQIDALNSILAQAEPTLSKMLTFESLVNEAHVLNVLESSIPESLRFDLHLDMILKIGKSTVSDYYTAMPSGHNYILEAARKVFPNSPMITESIETFRAYLISMINEDAFALSQPLPDMAGSFDKAVAGGELEARTGDSKWGILKKLWNAITEGGSTIGIIHFIIDIIGVFGDFIVPGVGVVADIINAIIYAIRGEWILCAINVIAAIFVGFGDTLKLLKGSAKGAQKLLSKLMGKEGAKEGAEMIAKMSAKESGGVIKLLTTIFGNIGGALGKATSLFGTFVSAMGKVTSWVPGLGKLLTPIYEGLGRALTKFGDGMSLASANLKLATTGAKKSAAMTIDAAVKSGGDFIFDGPWVRVMSKEGKEIGKYPVKQLDALTSKQLLEVTSKKAGSGANILYKNADDIPKVEKVLKDPKIQDGFRKRAYAFFESTPKLKGMARMLPSLKYFIGKQIYKIIFGTNFVDGAQNRWDKREVEGHGNGALNDWISDRIAKEKAESGAVYIPALMLDSQDQEVVDRITKYQNKFAKDLNQPSIMHVVTNKYDKESAPPDVRKFFDEVERGNVKRGGSRDRVDHSDADRLSNQYGKIGESKSPKIIRNISNFSDFK